MATAPHPAPMMAPVPLSERIELLDVLRGAALFGILAANMRAFNSPLAAYIDHSIMWTGAADRIVQGFIDLFITGKFITLFSFLFGIGFAVQMDRAADRGVPPRGFYLRRLTVLLIMGLAHAFLLWWGDVLWTYAVMGFLLYLFRNSSQRSLLIGAATLYCWPLLAFGAMVAATAGGAQIPMPARTSPEELQRIVAVYSGGTYAQIFQERLKDLAFTGFGLFFYYLRILGIFLLGVWLWRAGIVRHLGGREALLRRCRTWGFLVGLAGNAAVLAITETCHPDPVTPSPVNYLVLVTGSIGVPALSLAYASTLALLFRDPAWRARFRPFAAVGRTALTNYLLQTVVCTTLYYSWGFGLYGKAGPLLGLAVTLLVYAAQIPLSQWWLLRHNFGPMEWIWRLLTYGRLPSERTSPAATL